MGSRRGPDPEGDASYRLYRHAEGCLYRQRIARANLQTGRFDCATCGETWTAAPSALYLMQFTLPSGTTVLKLGFARNPQSQLRNKAAPAKLLRVVPVANGHLACRIEKRLHARLRHHLPEAVVPHERFAGHLRVTSEIYTESLAPYTPASTGSRRRRRQTGAARPVMTRPEPPQT